MEECGLRFDHLGVVVAEMGAGRSFLESALGVRQWTAVVEDAGIGVDVQFGTGGDGMVYELIAPRGESSPVSNALRSGKHILNHVAYRTDDLAAAGERLRAQGCVATGAPKPAVAYSERRVQFFVSPLRFVVELIEALEHEHAYEAKTPAAELVR
jgi:methylmalonyl-CoA/ethylmalonyl-CoA epimerase